MAGKQVLSRRVDLLQSIRTEPDLLSPAPNCRFCGTKRIYLEPPGFCCSSGEIKLLQTDMPASLVSLFLENSEDAMEFRKCVRSYNNMFAFTSW